MGDKTEDRKLVNLRYRMKKSGYIFNEENKVVILPEDNKYRSLKREIEIKKFGFDLQHKLI